MLIDLFAYELDKVVFMYYTQKWPDVLFLLETAIVDADRTSKSINDKSAPRCYGPFTFDSKDYHQPDGTA